MGVLFLPATLTGLMRRMNWRTAKEDPTLSGFGGIYERACFETALCTHNGWREFMNMAYRYVLVPSAITQRFVEKEKRLSLLAL